MSPTKIRIGTRGSALALAQAHETRARLAAVTGRPEDDFEIVVIKTSGDRILDRPLSEVGGKGLFTKEIEEALLDGSIDLAVHSSKDMPTVLPDGLFISAFLPREDVRDAWISPRAKSLADLPAGAKVGTSSLRRRAMVRRLRPDLEVVEFRGNVQTRLKKLADGVADATLLGMHGSTVLYVVWVLGLSAALLTAIYMTRMMLYTFHGPNRSGDAARPHLDYPVLGTVLFALGLWGLRRDALPVEQAARRKGEPVEERDRCRGYPPSAPACAPS